LIKEVIDYPVDGFGRFGVGFDGLAGMGIDGPDDGFAGLRVRLFARRSDGARRSARQPHHQHHLPQFLGSMKQTSLLDYTT